MLFNSQRLKIIIMLIKLILLLITILLNSCAAPLSSAGSQIRIVTENQKECCCRFIAVITTSESFGLGTGMDAESAMNKARNRVAAQGGNAMKVLNIDSNEYSTTVVVESLDCSFESMKHSINSAEISNNSDDIELLDSVIKLEENTNLISIKEIKSKYVLVYIDQYSMKINDIYSIVRYNGNTFDAIGAAKVVKISENKAVLEIKVKNNNDIINITDKIKYK